MRKLINLLLLFCLLLPANPALALNGAGHTITGAMPKASYAPAIGKLYPKLFCITSITPSQTGIIIIKFKRTIMSILEPYQVLKSIVSLMATGN